jgi:hypothetical protein
MAPLAESVHFLKHPARHPIAQGDSRDLRDPSPRFKQDTRHTFLAKPPFERPATCQNSAWKGRIINDLRNPLLSFEFEVTV